MKERYENEHASCRVVMNPELPFHLSEVREVVDVQTDEDARRQGYATQLLQAVCEDADIERTVLILTPKPFKDGPMEEAALSAWYERFGFVQIQKKPALMARQARLFQPKISLIGEAVSKVTNG